MFFDWNFDSCAVSQAGQVWLTLLGLLQFVFCETWNGCSREDWDRCREGTLNPETGRYSEVVVILTELCVKIVWMQVFPFWLRAAIPCCTSRDGWIRIEIRECPWFLWSKLGLSSLHSNHFPTSDVAFSLVVMEFANKMSCGVIWPWRVSFANLGPRWFTSCATRRLAWSSTRFATAELCRVSWERIER